MAESTEYRAPRMHYIDGLRALAIIIVLLIHCNLNCGISKLDVHFAGRTTNLADAFLMGASGVNLFLLLSGFCLYWPFVKRGSHPEPTLAQFAWRLCHRILPPYYVALALFGGLALFQAVSHYQIYHRDMDTIYVLKWFAWHV